MNPWARLIFLAAVGVCVVCVVLVALPGPAGQPTSPTHQPTTHGGTP